ncbi:MAG: hypothetical protein GX934_07180 [Burkholderiales bacterium]|nr:hypothetical protein [Burkholderiales bacterium]
MSTAEVRLTTQTGPSHPHPGVGGVSTPRRPNATPGGGFRFYLSLAREVFVALRCAVRAGGGP